MLKSEDISAMQHLAVAVTLQILKCSHFSIQINVLQLSVVDIQPCVMRGLMVKK